MLRWWRRNWVWVVGLPVILAALAHWGFHFYVKYRLGELIRQAASEVTIEYRQLDTSLGGKVELSTVSVVPVGQANGARIQNLRLTGPNLFNLALQYNPLAGYKGPPDFLRLKLSGVKVDLGGGLAAYLDARTGGQNSGNEAVCAPGQGVTFQTLKNLGYQQLAGEVNLGYRLVPHAQRLGADLNLDLEEIQRVAAEMSLTNVSRHVLQDPTAVAAALQRFHMEYYLAPAFGKKLAAWCAEKRGVSVTDYEQTLTLELVRDLGDKGVVLGYGLRQAVQHFFTTWGSLEVELEPPVPLSLFALPFIPPEQLVSKLALKLKLNGSQVSDLGFHLAENALLVNRDEAQNKPRKPPPVRYKWVYRSISPASLPNWLDHEVRLQERGDPVRSGRLVEVANGQAAIEQRLSGGTFLAHLSLAEITAAQVRVKVKVAAPASTP